MQRQQTRSIMAEMGMAALGVAFVAAVTAVVCAIAGWCLQRRDDSRAPRAWRVCGIAMLLVAGALSAAVVLLAWCFLVNDFSLIYVAYSHPQGENGARWLSRISAIWAGKSGSLLVWAWLVSLWTSPLAVISVRKGTPFEGAAVGFVAAVLVCLVGVMLFSSDNMPFWPTPAELLDESGNLVAAASGWGMSATLDHWAMDIHPFLLFAGYAGFTIPCALTVSFLLGYGEERAWRTRALAAVTLAWACMTGAIVLGAVWANSTPGWSGYWSWDAVETASLVPWISALVAMVALAAMSLSRANQTESNAPTIRNNDGWRAILLPLASVASVFAFAGVMICAFVTRSGIIATIHGYAGDSASAWMFAIMALVSIAIAIAAWKATEGQDDFDFAAVQEGNVIDMIGEPSCESPRELSQGLSRGLSRGLSQERFHESPREASYELSLTSASSLSSVETEPIKSNDNIQEKGDSDA